MLEPEEPVEMEVYRGEPRSPEEIGMMAHGLGRYYSLEPEGAELFSKEDTVKMHSIDLASPIFIGGDEDLRKLKQMAEEELDYNFGREGNIYEILTNRRAPLFSAWLRSKGIDGLIIDYPLAAGGRQAVTFPSFEEIYELLPEEEKLKFGQIRTAENWEINKEAT